MRSPLRPALRSTLYSPLVGKWGGGAPDFRVTDASTLEAALAAASAGDWIQGNGFVYRGAIALPAPNLRLSGFSVYGSDLVTGMTQEAAASEGAGTHGYADEFSDFTVGETNGGTFATESSNLAPGSTSGVRTTVTNQADARVNGYMTVTAHALDTSRRDLAYVYYAGGMRNSSEWRCLYLKNNTTNLAFVSIFSNSSGVPSTITLNGNGTNAGGLMVNQAALNGAFVVGLNRIEIRYDISATVGGGALYVNGQLIGTSAFNLNTSGAAGLNRVYVGSFAFGTGLSTGSYAIFSGVKSSLTAISAELQATDARKWSKTYGASPSQLIVDGARYERVANLAAVLSPYKWTIDSGTLYLFRDTTSATHPVVEASVRRPIDLNGQDGATIEEMDIRYSVDDGIFGEDGEENPTIKNCTFDSNFVRAYNLYGIADRAAGTISGNTIVGSGGSGGEVKGIFHGLRHLNNRYEDCCQLHEGLVGGHAEQEWSAGFKAWGDAEHDAWSDNLSEGNIYKNCKAQFGVGTQPFKRGNGIWLDDEHGTDGRALAFTVRSDIAIGTQSNGHFYEKVEDVLVEDCVAIDCGDVDYTTTFKVEANNAPTENAARVTVSHCTGYTAHNWAFAFNADAVGVTLDDCTLIDSVFDGGVPESFYGANVNDTTHGLGNVVQYSNFGPNTANFIRVNTTGYATLAAAQAAVAWMTNNVAGDPLFIDAANNDLRPGPGSPLLNAASDGTNIGASEATLLRAMAA